MKVTLEDDTPRSSRLWKLVTSFSISKVLEALAMVFTSLAPLSCLSNLLPCPSTRPHILNFSFSHPYLVLSMAEKYE